VRTPVGASQPPVTLTSYTPACRQLRNLIACPQERGLVNYIQPKAIVEHDLHDDDAVSHPYTYHSSRPAY
jgi:hypothetical protein